MYWTPAGERVLTGAERRLFEESLGMIVDLLSDTDADFGVRAFDELQRGQKLFVLYRAGRALLSPDEPMPELTSFLEATVAAIYQFMIDQVVQEMEEPEFAFSHPSWRSMVLDAIRERDDLDELPHENSYDISEWELLIECLEGARRSMSLSKELRRCPFMYRSESKGCRAPKPPVGRTGASSRRSGPNRCWWFPVGRSQCRSRRGPSWRPDDWETS